MIRQMLLAARGDDITKTELVYATRSTFTRATPIIQLLIDCSLLEKLESDGLQIYKTTTKGIEVLSAIGFVATSLKRIGSNPYEEDVYLGLDELVKKTR